MIRSFSYLLLGVAMISSAPAFAASQAGQMPVQETVQHSAAESTAENSTAGAKHFTSGVADSVLAIMNAKDQTQAEKLAKLETMFADAVDVAWVGRFVLGQFWRSASDAQKEAYLAAYKDFLIKHYTSRFAEYSGETFAIPTIRDDKEGRYLVRMVIQRTEGKAPVTVDYRVRYRQGKFQVFDIIVEGVSLITTQRSEFSSVANREGLNALIHKLKKKTESLSKQMAK